MLLIQQDKQFQNQPANDLGMVLLLSGIKELE